MLQLKQDLKTEHTTYSYQNSSNGDFFYKFNFNEFKPKPYTNT